MISSKVRPNTVKITEREINTPTSSNAKPYEIHELEITLSSGFLIAAKAFAPANATHESKDIVKMIGFHGWLDNANTFNGLGPLLAQSGVYMLAVDFPGSGRSQHKSFSNYHLLTMLPDMLDIIDTLQWEQCYVIGHSMGGAYSCFLPALFPERILGLITIDVPLFGRAVADPSMSAQILRTGIQSHLKNVRKQNQTGDGRRIYESKEAAARVIQKRFPHGVSMKGAMALVERGTEEVRDKDTGAVLGVRFRYDLNNLSKMMFAFSEEQINPIAKNIRCPVLVIMGTKGIPWGDPKFIENRWIEVVPQAKYVWTDAVGHHFHLDSPEAIIDNILDLVRSNSTSASASNNDNTNNNNNNNNNTINLSKL